MKGLSIAIRNIKIAKEIHKKPDILVRPVIIQAETYSPEIRITAGHHTKDRQLQKVDLIIKDQAALKVDNIANLHRPIHVRQPIQEVQDHQIIPILHPVGQVHPDLILLQAEAAAILPAGAVVAPEVREVVPEVREAAREVAEVQVEADVNLFNEKSLT